MIKKNGTPKFVAGPHAESADYFQKVLNSVVDFLLVGGMSAVEIQNVVATRLLAAPEKKGAKSKRSALPKAVGIDTVSALVLHRWYRDENLLDEQALPIAIRLYGHSPSVEALALAEESDVPARTIALAMKSSGLIKKVSRGLYAPEARVATIATLHPVLVEHASKSLVRFLETVQRNTSSDKEKLSLIERFTHIPDLPLDDLRAFQVFSQGHGSSFLAGVDDWLESRRQSGDGRKKKSGLAAGIHVFAYVENTKEPKGKLRARAKPV